jgi:hypothetical protein
VDPGGSVFGFGSGTLVFRDCDKYVEGLKKWF